jgi:hypothetical protein
MMSNLDTLRAIQDAMYRGLYSEARAIVYRAIVAEQKSIADQKNEAPARPGA